MSRLAELQQNFQHCLMHSQQVNDDTQDFTLDDNQDKTQIDWITDSGRATPKKQLSIYANGYRLRLKEVLENDFPATLMAIGEPQFEQLSDAYIDAHPSHYFSLREFGKHFSTFVSTLDQIENTPWLPQLTLFEWSLGQAFDAPDSNILSAQDLSTIAYEDWPDLQFVIAPSVQLLGFTWNIPELWKNLTSQTPIPITAIPTASQTWLIWRENLVTQFRSIEADEQLALEALINAASFQGICEKLGEMTEPENVPLRAATLLKTWITQGLISRIG